MNKEEDTEYVESEATKHINNIIPFVEPMKPPTWEEYDIKTLERISELVTNMELNNFAQIPNPEGENFGTYYYRGKDHAYRDVMNIISSTIEHTKLLKKEKRK